MQKYLNSGNQSTVKSAPSRRGLEAWPERGTDRGGNRKNPKPSKCNYFNSSSTSTLNDYERAFVRRGPFLWVTVRSNFKRARVNFEENLQWVIVML